MGTGALRPTLVSLLLNGLFTQITKHLPFNFYEYRRQGHCKSKKNEQQCVFPETMSLLLWIMFDSFHQ